jgi:PmbA protein
MQNAPAMLSLPPLTDTRDRAAAVLEEAARQGATSAEVGVSLSQGFSVSVRLGEVEEVEFNRDRGFAVTVYLGLRKGSASSTDDSPQSIRETVAAACAIARHTSEDPCAGIAAPEQLARDIPDLDLEHVWSISPDEAIDQALACESAGRADKRISNSEGATVSTARSQQVYANSNGFLAGFPATRHGRSCVLVAEQDGHMQRDFWFDSGCDAATLASPEAIGERAAARTLSRLGARRPPTGNVPVLFAPEVASGLLGHFAGAINGNALYRNASFLKGQLGESVFPDWVTVFERPHWRGMAGSSPFDSDGLPTGDKDFVRAGELKSWALGLYAARRLKAQATGNGNGVHNLCITDSGQDQQALLRDMGRGVLVTEVMGPGVNMVTGDYSRGAAGFWVEDGEIQYPVEEFTIAGHLGDMFKQIRGSGTDVDHRGNIHTGSLLVDGMKVAGE